MKNLKLKALVTIFLTFFNAWILYWLYLYNINVLERSIESSVLVVSLFGILIQSFVIWLCFGLDIIISQQ